MSFEAERQEIAATLTGLARAFEAGATDYEQFAMDMETLTESAWLLFNKWHDSLVPDSEVMRRQHKQRLEDVL